MISFFIHFKSKKKILDFIVVITSMIILTIYKVGKCMMPSVLKVCSDFKSHVCFPAFGPT